MAGSGGCRNADPARKKGTERKRRQRAERREARRAGREAVQEKRLARNAMVAKAVASGHSGPVCGPWFGITVGRVYHLVVRAREAGTLPEKGTVNVTEAECREAQRAYEEAIEVYGERGW